MLGFCNRNPSPARKGITTYLSMKYWDTLKNDRNPSPARKGITTRTATVPIRTPVVRIGILRLPGRALRLSMMRPENNAGTIYRNPSPARKGITTNSSCFAMRRTGCRSESFACPEGHYDVGAVLGSLAVLAVYRNPSPARKGITTPSCLPIRPVRITIGILRLPGRALRQDVSGAIINRSQRESESFACPEGHYDLWTFSLLTIRFWISESFACPEGHYDVLHDPDHAFG